MVTYRRVLTERISGMCTGSRGSRGVRGAGGCTAVDGVQNPERRQTCAVVASGMFIIGTDEPSARV